MTKNLDRTAAPLIARSGALRLRHFELLRRVHIPKHFHRETCPRQLILLNYTGLNCREKRINLVFSLEQRLFCRHRKTPPIDCAKRLQACTRARNRDRRTAFPSPRNEMLQELWSDERQVDR